MEKDNKSNIILFPDFQKLKEDVDRMKVEVSMLLLECDELQYVICKNIETAYLLKLGAIEYKAYEAQCAALRLKRKIELIQANINRQEQIDIAAIELILDAEFVEYQKKLNEQIEKMNEAIERCKCEVLTDEENRELKKLYRSIVKVLHPDLNPDVTQAQLVLLDNAISAYKNGDLVTLRMIELMVVDQTLPEQKQDAMGVLAKEKERLEQTLAAIRERIGEIKQRYPYIVKDIVEDPRKEAECRVRIEDILRQYKELIDIYNAKLKELLG